MILTDAERQKFIEWLTENIESNKLLMPQLTMHELRQKYTVETLGMQIVKRLLEATHAG